MAHEETVELGIPGLGPATWIASGGFADVYRARQLSLHRDVAVKVLRNRAVDDTSRQRFERECRAIGSVSAHPNIVGVHDSGFTNDGRSFLVMDFVAGGSLAEQSEGPVPWPRACDIMVKIAKALAVAHDVGVVHRDIKPENILLSVYDEPLLADFGVARVEGGMQTETGRLTFTLYHAAPELLEGQTPAVGSDVYALGSTLYTLLLGHPPVSRGFEQDSAAALIMRILSEPLPDPRAIGVPDPVARVIETAMDRDPHARYATAADFAEALAAAAAHAPSGVAAGTTGPGPYPTTSAAPIPPLPPLPPLLTPDADRVDGVAAPVAPSPGPAPTGPAPVAEPTAPPPTRRWRWPLVAGAVVVAAAVAGALALTLGGSDDGGGSPVDIPRGAALAAGVMVITEIQNTWEIATLDVDTGAVSALTDNNAGQTKLPALSPDRRSVAYTWQREGGTIDLWIIGSDGADQLMVTTGLNPDARATWSPDGSRLAFISEAKGRQDLVVLDLRSGDVEELTTDTSQKGDPSWSPDGRSIAFWESQAGGNRDLVLVDVASKALTPLTTDPAVDADPDWDPTGTRLAFTRGSASGCGSIWTVDVASGTETPVTNGEAARRDDGDPSWSMTGDRIAFESRPRCDPAESLAVAVVGADGSGFRTVTDGTFMAFHPSW